MTIFLDIIGSWVIRASLIAVMLTLTVNLNNVLYESTQRANTNGLVSVVDSVIYADLNAAGFASKYCVYFKSDTTFNAYNAQSVYFYADIVTGGTAELVKYYTTYSATTKLYKLYRQVNSGTAFVVANNLSGLAFSYYDANGNVTATKSSIKQVRVMVTARYVLTNSAVQTEGLTSDTTYVSASFRVVPPNLVL